MAGRAANSSVIVPTFSDRGAPAAEILEKETRGLVDAGRIGHADFKWHFAMLQRRATGVLQAAQVGCHQSSTDCDAATAVDNPHVDGCHGDVGLQIRVPPDREADVPTP